ncbi:MAG: bile acid:sodium symporter family protein [Cytophagales bacterium]|nr:bile acid:sodium symporter family protein [Cytophagales bacterium]
MQASVLTTLVMPIALGIIMLGLGLSLTLEDFRRVARFPKAITIALVCQMILLPALCFLLARSFALPPELAVGLMLLAASPGGATANLYSHLSNGDVALNITLTAVNSVLSLFTLPLIVNFSLLYFMNADQYLPMQFGKVMEVFAIVLLPVIGGMLIKARAPGFAAKMDKPVKVLSALFLALIIAAVTIKERHTLVEYFVQIGLPVLAFNVLSMVAGYFIPLLFRIGKKQAIAIGMEIGIHNGTLAIYIALNVLGNSTMSLPPGLYGLLMFFTAAAFGFLVNIGARKETA